VARVELADRISVDLQRIVAHLAERDGLATEDRVSGIFRALGVLEENPLIGRLSSDEWRELVIGRDAHGYLALYIYKPLDDTVYVLAIRSQREAGYAADSP
jgi:plasmid stabilization system protein ParE